MRDHHISFAQLLYVAWRHLCLTWVEHMGSSMLLAVALFKHRPKEFAT